MPKSLFYLIFDTILFHFHILFIELQSRVFHPHILIGKSKGDESPFLHDQATAFNDDVPSNDTIAEIAPHIIIPKGDDAALIRLRAQSTLRKIRASWLFLEHQVNA